MYNIFSPRPSSTLFIDENYLKQTTELGQNVDAHLIINSIQTAQDLFILPILGSDYFEYLKMAVSGNTLTAPDFKLISQYLQPCLAQATMWLLLPKISFQFRNKGVMVSKSESSDQAKTEDIVFIAEKYRETASFYGQRMTNFLTSNPDIYILYNTTGSNGGGNGGDVFFPNDTSYTSGIFIPQRNNSGGLYPRGWGLTGIDWASITNR
jgi:hypothetical protein